MRWFYSHRVFWLDKEKAGEPKKGGAGSGTVWGKPGDEVKYLDDKPAMDKNDPNFDPSDEADEVMQRTLSTS